MSGASLRDSPVIDSSVVGSQVTGSKDCYKTKSGKCGDPLTQGDCGEGEWLILGDSGVLECKGRDCQKDQIPIDKKCLGIDDIYICTGPGKLKYILKQNVTRITLIE